MRRHCFEQIIAFFFLEIWRRTLGFRPKFYGAIVKPASYMSKGKIWGFFCAKFCFQMFLVPQPETFGNWAKKSLSVGKSCFLRVRNIVLIKFFHLKKSFDCFETLIEKILDCERFKKWLSVKKFRLGTQNCNLSVFAKTLIFRSLCDNFPDFLAKIFVRVMKYAFYGGLE